jgi:hypothetical protein
MSDVTITEFCERHNACPAGREWAIENCADMAEAWATAQPRWLVWIATRRGVLTNRELRLCAVQAARRVEHLMADQRSRDAVAVAERHADGLATDEELAAADSAAYAVYSAAYSAYSAADAAAAAAWSATAIAADAAYVAASAAASAAAYVAVADSAYAASWQATAEWLRENTSPNFTKEGDR